MSLTCLVGAHFSYCTDEADIYWCSIYVVRAIVLQNPCAEEREEHFTAADRDALTGPINGIRAANAFIMNIRSHTDKLGFDFAVKPILNLNSSIRKGKMTSTERTCSNSVPNLYKCRLPEIDEVVRSWIQSSACDCKPHCGRLRMAHAFNFGTCRLPLSSTTWATWRLWPRQASRQLQNT